MHVVWRSFLAALMTIGAVGTAVAADFGSGSVVPGRPTIEIWKSQRRMELRYGEYVDRQFKVSLGRAPHFAKEERGDFRTPVGSIVGPKAMIVNENAGSGGDLMPWYFRKAKVGPLIGKRTWGGLVGIFGFPELIDGGRVTAPNLAFYNTEAEWDVENRGVAPDIEVEFDPPAWRQGRDTQLEKAVEVLMAELKKNPPHEAKRPPYPNYHTLGTKH